MHELFGRYTLHKRLAVGGMAEIFLASLHTDAGFHKQLVVKRILPHLSQDSSFVKMFINEANLAARLTHPNIVQVFDFGDVAGSYFMAMEYIEGVDLHTLMQHAKARGERFTPAMVAALGAGMAHGLAYTHNLADEDGRPLGIVHRDVTPHNLMLSESADPKLMDFGIAKAAARLSRTATGVGTIKGKLGYMAPEQAAGLGATKLSDQFSLGVMLWECLAGQRLFVGDNDISLMQTVLNCQITDLADVAPDVPAPLRDIIMRALRKNPQERFEDLSQMHDALEKFRFSLGVSGIAPLKAWVHAALALAAKPSVQAMSDKTTTSRRQVVAQDVPLNSTRVLRTGEQRAQALGHKELPRPTFFKKPAPPLSSRYRTTWRMERRPKPAMRQRSWTKWGSACLMVLGLCLPLGLWARTASMWVTPTPSVSPPPAHAEASRKHTGRLFLRTDGPAVAVYLGTTRLGTTPLNGQEVPAGKLALRLVNEATGTWKNYQIFVPKGGRAQGVISHRIARR